MLELRDGKPQWPRVWDQADVFPDSLKEKINCNTPTTFSQSRT